MRSALQSVKGVKNVDVDNTNKTATVMFDAASGLSASDLVSAFENTKFTAKVEG